MEDTLKTALARFGFVTVFDAKFFELDDTGAKIGDKAVVELDSLTVANITQEGPTKTIKGGMYAETLLRYGKTMRLEMENAIATADAIEHLGGGQWEGETELRVTDKFAKKMRIEGRTFVIKPETGEKVWINIIFPRFVPDSVFDVSLEAEGDFGTFSINGDLAPDKCGVFYYLTQGVEEKCAEETSAP